MKTQHVRYNKINPRDQRKVILPKKISCLVNIIFVSMMGLFLNPFLSVALDTTISQRLLNEKNIVNRKIAEEINDNVQPDLDSPLAECQSGIVSSDNNLDRESLAKYDFEMATKQVLQLLEFNSSFDATALQSFISDTETDFSSIYFSLFDTLSGLSTTKSAFAKYACRHINADDDDMAKFCSNQDSSEGDLPETAMIDFSLLQNDEKKEKILSHICSSIIDDQVEIIDGAISFFQKEGLLKKTDASDKGNNETTESRFPAEQCRTKIMERNKLTRNRFSKLIFSFATKDALATGDVSDELKHMLDSEGEMVEDVFPTFHLLPTSVLASFSTYACKYRDEEDDSTEDYCKEETPSVQELPKSATIHLNQIEIEWQNQIVIELCDAIDIEYSSILNSIMEHYKVLLENEEKREKKESESKDLMDVPMSFSIRVISSSVDHEAIEEMVSSELKRLVGKSHVLEDTSVKFVGVKIQALNAVTCHPPSVDTACFNIISTITLDAKEHKDIEDKVIHAITKDQKGGAYFSNLEGFGAMPPKKEKSKPQDESNTEQQQNFNNKSSRNNAIIVVSIFLLVSSIMMGTVITIYHRETTPKDGWFLFYPKLKRFQSLESDVKMPLIQN